MRLQHDQAVATEQARQSRRHRVRKPAAARGEQFCGVGGEARIAGAFEVLPRGLPHLVRYRQLADRPARVVPLKTHPAHTAVAGQEVGMIDLAEIVVFGGQPEHRHATAPELLLIALGEPDRGNDLVQRIRGPAHEAGLLPGMHTAGVGFAERPRRRQRRVRRAERPLVVAQHTGQPGPGASRRLPAPQRRRRVAGGVGEVSVGPAGEVVQVEAAAPVHLTHRHAVRFDQLHAAPTHGRPYLYGQARMGAVAERVLVRLLALTERVVALLFDGELQRLEFGALVRAVAKRLVVAGPATAPPVAARLQFQYRGLGMGHLALDSIAIRHCS